MKQIILKKFKMINWLDFTNTTISHMGNIFITGENGSGKSVVMDAITMAITLDQSKFNSAANDMNGNRTLKSYIRHGLMDSSTNNSYKRSGDVISYLICEFFNKETESTFSTILMMRSPSDIADVKKKYFTVPGKGLADIEPDVIEKRDGKQYVKNIALNENYRGLSTLREAYCEYAALYGWTKSSSIDVRTAFKRNAENILKSISFKASDIKNTDDFIKTQLLPIPTNDIDSMLSHLEEHRKLSETVDKISLSQSRLKEISDILTKREELLKEINLLESSLKVMEKQRKEAKVKNLKANFDRNNTSIIISEENQNKYDEQLSDVRNEISQIRMSGDTKGLLEKIKSEKYKLNQRISLFKLISAKTQKVIECAKRMNIPIDEFSPLISEDKARETLTDFDVICELIKESIAEYEVKKRQLLIELKSLKDKKEDIQTEIDELSQNKVNIERENPDAANLLKYINRELKNSEAHFVYQDINIADQTWSNAIESSLGNNRFAIVVSADNYNTALNIYKKHKELTGVSLIDTRNLNTLSYESGCILEKMTFTDKNTEKFVSMLLRNIFMISDIGDVDNSSKKQYITSDLMFYSKSCVKRNRKLKRFIGSDAIKQMLSDKRKELSDIISLICQKENEIKSISKDLDNMKSVDMNKIDNRDELEDCIEKISEISELRGSIKTDEEAFIINDMSKKLKPLTEKEAAIKAKLNMEIMNIGRLTSENKTISEDMSKIEKEIENIIINESEMDIAINFIERKKADKRIRVFDDQYINQSITSLKSKCGELIGECRNREHGYLREFEAEEAYCISYTLDELGGRGNEFFLSKYMGDSSDYNELTRQLSESGKMFREKIEKDCIGNLRGDYMAAEEERKALNKRLSKARMRNLRYHMMPFSSIPGSEAMFKLISGEALNEEDEKIKDSVIQSIVSAMMEDTDNRDKVSKMLDYRRYIKADIVVTDTDTDKSMTLQKYLKICSGGESQYPYYALIGMSLLCNFRRNGVESVFTPIMVDECFDKMDKETTQNIINFLTKDLKLQIIIAAPTSKYLSSEFHDGSILYIYKNKDKKRCVANMSSEEFYQKASAMR